MSGSNAKSSALPKQWIVPIRLVIYSVLAGCSAYVYFNVGDLELTHYLVVVSIVVVAAMALLDCRVSDDYWRRRAQEAAGQPAQDTKADNEETR